MQPIIIYGAAWCPDARRSRRLLDELKTSYQWIDVDTNDQARQFVQSINNGQLIIPVILFPDESFLVEPTNEDLSGKMTELMPELQISR